MIRKFTEFVKSVVEHSVKGSCACVVLASLAERADRHQDKHITCVGKPEKLQTRTCFFLQVRNWSLGLDSEEIKKTLRSLSSLNAVLYSIPVLPVPRNAILPGMTRLTSVPESTELTILSLPPMRAARSRMPCKP